MKGEFSMFCSNCGNQVIEGSQFCPKCGNKINTELVADEKKEEEITEVEENVWEVTNVIPENIAPDNIPPVTAEADESSAAVQPKPEQPPKPVDYIPQAPVPHPTEYIREPKPVEPSSVPEIRAPHPTVQKMVPPTVPQPKQSAEKQFFGMGAFIFCVVIIILLSVVSGVFAGLYFGEKSNRTYSNAKGEVEISDFVL